MENIKLYRVSADYVDYLAPAAKHLFHNKQAGQQNERAYVGIVLHIGDMDYFAPLSSFKEKAQANAGKHRFHQNQELCGYQS